MHILHIELNDKGFYLGICYIAQRFADYDSLILDSGFRIQVSGWIKRKE